MENAYVSIDDFKKLEQKVNELLAVHELDKLLTSEEKQLVREAKNDIKNNRKENFISVDEL